MSKKTMGRPPTLDKPAFVGIKLPGKMVRQIDRYAASIFENRSEAIRDLIERGLRHAAKETKS